MDFIDQLKTISARIPKQRVTIKTEEATKHAFVMPFIQALGYDVFDPAEVVPEFVADVGSKKGEKVDYAIMRDDTPIMLFECKSCGASLDEAHAAQLRRYFHVTHTRVGVLTNGIEYRFYSDLDAQNKMDEKPFLVFDMGTVREDLVGELKRLSKGKFDLKELLSAAGDLKYTGEIKKVLAAELEAPSDEFVRFLVKRGKVYEGNLIAQVREQFAEIVRRGFRQFIEEQMQARLKTAFGQGVDGPPPTSVPESDAQAKSGLEPSAGGNGDKPVREGVETTQEEVDAFNIVRAIVCEVVDLERVTMRDTKSYCGVLLDDNNRKPLCRLRFNAASKKYLGMFDADKNEERVPIERVEDIFQHAGRLRETIAFYAN